MERAHLFFCSTSCPCPQASFLKLFWRCHGMRLSCCVNPGAGCTHAASILVVVVVVVLQAMLVFEAWQRQRWPGSAISTKSVRTAVTIKSVSLRGGHRVWPRRHVW